MSGDSVAGGGGCLLITKEAVKAGEECEARFNICTIYFCPLARGELLIIFDLLWSSKGCDTVDTYRPRGLSFGFLGPRGRFCRSLIRVCDMEQKTYDYFCRG